jgi:hypothetical protein
MWLIDQIAEQCIAEAVQQGAFDHLQGAGKPLSLEDDSLVPVEMRVAYRLLKNAGYLPPELNLRREIADVNALLTRAGAAVERERLSKRRNYLLMQLRLHNPASPLVVEDFYLRKVIKHGV